MDLSGIMVLLTIAVTQVLKVLIIDRIEALQNARVFALMIVAVLIAVVLSAMPLETLPIGVIEGVLATGTFSSVMQMRRGNQ